MLEQLSVPRRPFDFEDYIGMLRRNLRWILAPAFAGLVLSTALAFFIDDAYVSRAVIRFVPQQSSESGVQTATSQQLTDRIKAMTESIESRDTLTNLINTYGLYKRELKSEPIEDVITRMRTTDIKIQPASGVANVAGENLPGIQVSFSYRDRLLAQKVCADLVSRLTNERAVGTLTDGGATNGFLNDEFGQAKRDLDALDQKLTDFRKRNAGHLPEQGETNAPQMNAAQQRLSALNAAVRRNNEQHRLLESNLRNARNRLASIEAVPPEVQARNEHLQELDREIQKVETNIAELQDRYTEDSPDLQNARAQLVALKHQREDAAKQDKSAAENQTQPKNPATSRARQDAQAAVDTLEKQLKANAAEAQQINNEFESVNASLKTSQGGVQNSPVGDQQYADLIRARDLAKQKYQELEAKRQKSGVPTDIGSHQQGEHLEVLDAASLPTAPAAPNRAMIIPGGVAAGLLFGIVLIAIREIRNTSLKNLKDAQLYTGLPVLGSIPLLENDVIVRRRRRITWLGWTCATLAGIAIMAASVAHYYWKA